LREVLRSIVERALERCRGDGTLSQDADGNWVVEIPKKSGHGDYATNAALVLAARSRRAPMDLAGMLVTRLEDPRGFIDRAEVLAPGFINFFLNRTVLLETLRDVIRQGDRYGRWERRAGEPIQVEFVSANPTGPLHIGHGRGAAVGDALAKILDAAGSRVFREYYVNDMGRQMEMLGRSTYFRYLEELGRPVDFPPDHYRGDYIRDLAREVRTQDGDRWGDVPEEQALGRFTEFARETILADIRKDLGDFRVHYDAWFRESSLYTAGGVYRTLDDLQERGLVYSHEGARWFRSTAFGDEKDRVVVRTDGRTTYLASDIAYHADKFRRGFGHVIDIWGADHHGYVPRMKGVVQALGRDPRDLRVLLVQMVSLLRNGEPVAMSTRAGEFTTLREVLDEVGVDAARYIFLMRSSDSHLDFDLEVAKRQERENPVYYVQYAHARICSILREAEQRGVSMPGPEDGDLGLLRLTEEWELVKDVVLYPDVIRQAASALEPHRLTYFLDGLAADFHAYYNRGWLQREARVISEEPDLTRARLLLVQALKEIFRSALGLLGVTAPEQM
jgi:arginyl-tRNA synthetase